MYDVCIMTPGEIFSIANTGVLPAWVLLACFPRWKWTPLLSGLVTPGILAILYVALLVSHWGETGGNFDSIGGVKQLFSNDWVLLAGWIHYLAFDLFTGCWVARDARRLEISHVLVVPCLVLTLMFGPAGLLSYLILRFVLRRKQARLAEWDRI
jgi:hypothetical protein